MEELYTVRKNKTRSSLWLRSWTPFTKFRLKLKKVGKTTRPFRYDLNQINYTVKVTNRFKDSDLIDRVPEELWTEVPDICIGGSDQDHPQGKEMKKAKWLPEEALQIAEKEEKWKAKEKRKIYPFECRVPKNSKERWESLPQWQVQRNRGKQYNRVGRLEISSRKLEIPREHIRQRWAQ